MDSEDLVVPVARAGEVGEPESSRREQPAEQRKLPPAYARAREAVGLAVRNRD